MARLKRAFHAVEKIQRRMNRIERPFAAWRSKHLPTAGKAPVSVVTACMTPDGTPTFTLHTVGVTAAELADGLHYQLVVMQLFKRGYEEPFVHFPENESPAFLHPAMRHCWIRRPVLMTPFFTYFQRVNDEPHHRSNRLVHRRDIRQTKGYAGAECLRPASSWNKQSASWFPRPRQPSSFSRLRPSTICTSNNPPI